MDECCICLETNNCIKFFDCDHVFHKECFDEYFDEGNNQKNTCPICKEAVIGNTDTDTETDIETDEE